MAGHTLPDNKIKTEIKSRIDAAALTDGSGDAVTVFIDFVEDNTVLDYFVVRKSADSLITNKQSWGNDQIYIIDMYTAVSTSSKIDSYLSDTLEVLTESVWTIAGFNWLIALLDGSFSFRDPDREATHGVLMIRVMSTGNERTF